MRPAPRLVNVDYRQPVELNAQQAARRLGVKRETLYAYVSRGALTSRRGADRSSRFDADEIEALARRGRPRRASRSPVFEIQIDSGITSIGRDSLRYRGHDVVRLATTATFEQVATLCWTGELPKRPPHWSGTPISAPDRGDLLERIRVLVALAALDDPAPGDLRPAAVVSRAATLIATVVDNLPVVGDGRAPRLVLAPHRAPLRGTIAGRLWARLARRRATPALVATLNAALVLLTDHELAASTFAARLAASVRADLPAVVSCGLGPLAGPLHGRASGAARALLDTAMYRGPAVAVAERLRTHGRVPAFGHPLYPEGDPRAAALLGWVRRAAGGSRAMAAVDGVLAAVQRRVPVRPNVDFAVAALGAVAAMPPDAGEALFAVARMAGWIAHALEEYAETPARFRPRANFVPAPNVRSADDARRPLVLGGRARRD